MTALSTPGAVAGTTGSSDTDDPWVTAPCLDEDPELFFPVGEDFKFQEAAVKAVCRDCDLRPECLRGALQRREPWGVWGGELFIAGQVAGRKRRSTEAVA